MTAHRRPCFPPTYLEKPPPGICKWCGEPGLPLKADGTPNRAFKYHPACSQLAAYAHAGVVFMRQVCIDRDGYKCVECGDKGDLEVDHIFPLWLVDRENPEAWKYWQPGNWQLLCGRCHKRKTKTEAKARAKGKRIRSRQNIPARPKSKFKRKVGGQVVLRDEGGKRGRKRRKLDRKR